MGESKARAGRKPFAEEARAGLDRVARSSALEVLAQGALQRLSGSFYADMVVRGANEANAKDVVALAARLRDGIDAADRYEVAGLPFWLGDADAVHVPGVTSEEFVALRRFVDDGDGFQWLEFDVGPVRKGLLLERVGPDLHVWDVAGYAALRRVAVFPYASALRAGGEGYVKRGVHDPARCYLFMATEEAKAAGVDPRDSSAVLNMMTREADMAALACVGLSFPSTRRRPVEGTRRVLVEVGREAAHDLARAAGGLAPWPLPGPALH